MGRCRDKSLGAVMALVRYGKLLYRKGDHMQCPFVNNRSSSCGFWPFVSMNGRRG